MPGENRTQAELISQNFLAQAAAQYLAAPLKILADQQALLATQLAQNRKKPAVFYSGTWMDAVNTYTPSPAGPVGKWLNAAGPITVKVFNLQDADSIVLRLWNFQSVAVWSPFVVFYVLSPSEIFNPVDLSQCSLLGGNQTIIATTAGSYQGQYLGDTILCAGNKWLHLFGYNANQGGGGDLWAGFTNPPTAFGPVKFNAITYALIK